MRLNLRTAKSILDFSRPGLIRKKEKITYHAQKEWEGSQQEFPRLRRFRARETLTFLSALVAGSAGGPVLYQFFYSGQYVTATINTIVAAVCGTYTYKQMFPSRKEVHDEQLQLFDPKITKKKAIPGNSDS